MKVRLGTGERLVFVGHDVALVAVGDTEDGEGVEYVYFAADWEAGAPAPARVDGDGDVAFLDGFGHPYAWAPVRSPRCPSEQRRAERLFARDFGDRMRART
jgi:hypothetical protein